MVEKKGEKCAHQLTKTPLCCFGFPIRPETDAAIYLRSCSLVSVAGVTGDVITSDCYLEGRQNALCQLRTREFVPFELLLQMGRFSAQPHCFTRTAGRHHRFVTDFPRCFKSCIRTEAIICRDLMSRLAPPQCSSETRSISLPNASRLRSTFIKLCRSGYLGMYTLHQVSFTFAIACSGTFTSAKNKGRRLCRRPLYDY